MRWARILPHIKGLTGKLNKSTRLKESNWNPKRSMKAISNDQRGRERAGVRCWVHCLHLILSYLDHKCACFIELWHILMSFVLGFSCILKLTKERAKMRWNVNIKRKICQNQEFHPRGMHQSDTVVSSYKDGLKIAPSIPRYYF